MSEKTTRRLFVTSIGAFGATALAGCSGNGGGGNGTSTEAEMTSTSTDEGMTQTSTDDGMDSESSLSVSDQTTDNRTVTIPSATIDGDGWVVVHPKSMDGGPNPKVTLTTKQLAAGEYSDIEVMLDTVHTGDQTVFAMLHYDDPADGKFTFPQNGDPPVTKDGNPIVKPFTVTLSGMVTPELSVRDQKTDGDALIVPRAALDKTGWLVIHPEAMDGGPNGKVTLATRQLQPGLYADVTMKLDESLSESQTVYAMLHYDDPADGKFTFPQNGDPAVKIDGSPAVKPFDVTVSM